MIRMKWNAVHPCNVTTHGHLLSEHVDSALSMQIRAASLQACQLPSLFTHIALFHLFGDFFSAISASP